MASGTQPVRSDPGKRSRQLNFEKAMSDFKSMFPSIEVDVIEMVLRANNGLVDATVDQLLTMQDETSVNNDNSLLDPHLNVRLPGYNDSGSLSSDPPPAYTPRVEDDPNFVYDSTFLSPALSNFSTPSPSQNTQATSKTTDWNPPLLGTLPNDFLRLNMNDHSQSSGRRDQAQHSITRNQERNTHISNHTSISLTPESTRTHLPRTEEKESVDRRNVNGFDGVPDNESKPKSSENKSKSKRFGHMSRKFKRKKNKSAKDNYKPISFANFADEDSSDDNAQR